MISAGHILRLRPTLREATWLLVEALWPVPSKVRDRGIKADRGGARRLGCGSFPEWTGTVHFMHLRL